MKVFIALLSTLACAVALPSGYSLYGGAYAYGPAHITVLPSGYLADTPEVAAAKAVHFAELGKAAAAAAASPDYTSYAAPGVYGAPIYPYYAGAYTGPAADIKVLPSGFLADTPEVAHAKAAHFAEVGKAVAAAAASPEYPGYYGHY